MLRDDMADLFRTRLHQLLIDHFDTCMRADLEPRDSAELIFEGLIGELVRGAVTLKISRDDFASMCSEAHTAMRPYVEQYLKTATKSKSH